MTPSNPTNQQPFIYRVADAAGVFHLVAPVDHTHTISEVAGLESALNTINTTLGAKANASDVNTALEGKQNTLTFDATPTANSTNPVTSGGVKAALDGKTGISGGNNGWVEVKDNGQVEIIGDQSVYIGISDMDGVSVTLDNIANLKRALLNPDSTPTANSTNLVTSGGVKAALDNKTSISRDSMDSIVEVEVKHVGDDEYDQAKVIGRNRIVLGVGADAEDGSAIIDANNITNLQRALLNPDSTPTANSTNLVTSGGVKTALEQMSIIRLQSAQSSAKPLIEDVFGDSSIQQVTVAILNSTGENSSPSDLFSVSAGQTLLSPDNAPTIPNGKMALIRLYRMQTQGYFLIEVGDIYTIQ